MPIMPVKVPQNVYIEDRIIGPITLRQIIITGIGAGISYAAWSAMSKAHGSVGIPLTVILWMPAAIAAAFAFLKINDLSLMRILFLSLERMVNPTVRIYAPRRGITITVRMFNTAADAAKRAPQEKAALPQLDDLSATLDAAESDAPRPVVRERVAVTPSRTPTENVDGVAPVARVSLFPPSHP